MNAFLEAKLGGSGYICYINVHGPNGEVYYEPELQYSHLGNMGKTIFQHDRGLCWGCC